MVLRIKIRIIKGQVVVRIKIINLGNNKKTIKEHHREGINKINKKQIILRKKMQVVTVNQVSLIRMEKMNKWTKVDMENRKVEIINPQEWTSKINHKIVTTTIIKDQVKEKIKQVNKILLKVQMMEKKKIWANSPKKGNKETNNNNNSKWMKIAKQKTMRIVTPKVKQLQSKQGNLMG